MKYETITWKIVIVFTSGFEYVRISVLSYLLLLGKTLLPDVLKWWHNFFLYSSCITTCQECTLEKWMDYLPNYFNTAQGNELGDYA